jgi:uncharacterized protein
MSNVEIDTEQVATVRSFLAAIKDQNVRGALALLSEDVRVDEPESLPWGGVHTGPKAFVSEVAAVMGGLASAAFDDIAVDQAGGDVIVRLRLTLTLKRTNRSVTVPIVEIYRVQAGRITSIDVFLKDTGPLLEGLAEDSEDDV